MAIEKDEPPVDNFLAAVYRVLKGEAEGDTVVDALEWVQDPEFRDVMSAFILSGAAVELVCNVLEVEPEVVHNFCELVLDKKVFKHRLEMRRYAQQYVAHVCSSEAMANLIKKAIIEGPTVVESFVLTGEERLSISRADMAANLAQMAYTKAMTVRHADLTDEESQEALKWHGSALRAISSLDSINDVADNELDALLAIERQDTTTTAEAMGIKPEDLLH